VFINHGDDDSVKAFKELLTGEGYHAEDPYSGTEFDLLTGRMTIYTEGRKIDRSVHAKGTQRAQAVFEELVAAAEELLRLVKKRRGMTNKDNAKLTDQIRNLINKWKN
jgi:chromosome condensin MukBEF MukE localization factor